MSSRANLLLLVAATHDSPAFETRSFVVSLAAAFRWNRGQANFRPFAVAGMTFGAGQRRQSLSNISGGRDITITTVEPPSGALTVTALIRYPRRSF